ncbi:MAG: hypothetical protein AB7S77_05655 [Desulfatirhabdiaceae bacterium]
MATFLNTSKKHVGIIIFYTCFILFVLYIPFNTKGAYQFKEIPGFPNYDMLASAFLAKQVHLLDTVDPKRLQADDPRDPSHPSAYLFDRVIWNGKYYFIQEPLPGIFHAIWNAITGYPFRTGAMVTLSISGVVIVLAFLMLHLRQLYFPSTPSWIFWGTWISFSLCSVQLHFASMPFVYNEAVGLGSFFSLLGILCAMHIFPVKRNEKTNCLAALAGTCFGAAVCCRASIVFYPLTFLLCLVMFHFFRERQYKIILNVFLPFLICFGLFIIALLAYNFLRFQDILEFGRNYAIYPSHEDYLYAIWNENMFRLKHVPVQFYLYLLSPPDIIDKFPYIIIPNESRFKIGDVLIVSQRVRSIFILVPILVVLIATPFLQKYYRNKIFSFWMTYFITASAAIFCFLTFFHYATIRYIYDFLPILFVILFGSYSTLWGKIMGDEHKEKIVKLLFIGLVSITVFNGLLAGYLKYRS